MDFTHSFTLHFRMEARVLEEALSVAQESSGVSAKIDLRTRPFI